MSWIFSRVLPAVCCLSRPPHLAAKKPGGVGPTEPLEADAATWAAVEATHGSLAACALAHVQALAVASAAAAAQSRVA